MSHSPAPWTFEYVGSSSAGDDGIDVYEVCNERTRIAEHMNLADARLISCAPDLLAALMRYVEDDDVGARIASPRYLAARTAIAKAEGK